MKYQEIMNKIQEHYDAIRPLYEEEAEARKNMDAKKINEIWVELSKHYDAINKLKEMAENYDLTDEEVHEMVNSWFEGEEEA